MIRTKNVKADQLKSGDRVLFHEGPCVVESALKGPSHVEVVFTDSDRVYMYEYSESFDIL